MKESLKSKLPVLPGGYVWVIERGIGMYEFKIAIADAASWLSVVERKITDSEGWSHRELTDDLVLSSALRVFVIFQRNRDNVSLRVKSLSGGPDDYVGVYSAPEPEKSWVEVELKDIIPGDLVRTTYQNGFAFTDKVDSIVHNNKEGTRVLDERGATIVSSTRVPDRITKVEALRG